MPPVSKGARATLDRTQRCFDFPRASAIPLAPRRAVAPSPNYHDMAQFVRRVRSAGLEPLKQLLAMVHFAVTDVTRLITDEDLPFVTPSPPARVEITDEDIPF